MYSKGSDHDESVAEMFFYFQSSQVQVTAISECVYPRSPAMALGLTSALSLMIAQIIINVSTGCICCKRNPHPSNSNWTVALICFVVSCINTDMRHRCNMYMDTVYICHSVSFVAYRAALNDQHGDESAYFNYYCYVVKPGVFAGGAMLSLASVALGIIYYLTLISAKNGDSLWGNTSIPNQGGIAMGQPQIHQGCHRVALKILFLYTKTHI
ncbi:hypothetical protein CFP56_037517 [Quercus suber]|uniref:Uncharacterized protein n=1 Tax=Quercus suber TaxID=58331 RepID=A0AAW0J531_QUESU